MSHNLTFLPPTQAMHAFRDNATSMLLATPAASRGLDLPAVSFVYSLGVPADSTDYLHRAGRAGRIGSPVDGAIPHLTRNTLKKPSLTPDVVYPRGREVMCFGHL